MAIWKKIVEENDYTEKAMNQLIDRLNRNTEKNICKIAASDYHGGTKALCFYSTTPIHMDKKLSTKTIWMTTRGGETRSDYEAMYKEALNKFNTLSEYQQFYASISFTNRKSENSYIEFCYPKD